VSCTIATVYRPEGLAIVTVTGTCGDADAVRLREVFDELIGEEVPAVILDLSAVEALGPNGMYAVLEGQRAAADTGTPMVAVLDTSAAADSPEWPNLTAVRNAMDTHPTLERALAALEG
jgi:anti-anti-sigma regulatory factor